VRDSDPRFLAHGVLVESSGKLFSQDIHLVDRYDGLFESLDDFDLAIINSSAEEEQPKVKSKVEATLPEYCNARLTYTVKYRVEETKETTHMDVD
jgi:hypothetical protein